VTGSKLVLASAMMASLSKSEKRSRAPPGPVSTTEIGKAASTTTTTTALALTPVRRDDTSNLMS
jgi:hypothetical protein